MATRLKKEIRKLQRVGWRCDISPRGFLDVQQAKLKGVLVDGNRHTPVNNLEGSRLYALRWLRDERVYRELNDRILLFAVPA